MPDPRSLAARKAWQTRSTAVYRARKSEKASKGALTSWCRANGWKVLFFEGDTGAPRTGIVDAIIARIRPEDADGIDLKLIQLKSGAGGLTATEIARLKRALARMSTDWVLAAFGGKVLHMLPEVPEKQRRRRV